MFRRPKLEWVRARDNGSPSGRRSRSPRRIFHLVPIGRSRSGGGSAGATCTPIAADLFVAVFYSPFDVRCSGKFGLANVWYNMDGTLPEMDLSLSVVVRARAERAATDERETRRRAYENRRSAIEYRTILVIRNNSWTGLVDQTRNEKNISHLLEPARSAHTPHARVPLYLLSDRTYAHGRTHARTHARDGVA